MYNDAANTMSLLMHIEAASIFLTETGAEERGENKRNRVEQSGQD
jgi:hypothetical protein